MRLASPLSAGPGPRYLRLQRQVEDAIARGDLRPGDSLPPERDLARLTATSRVTVRRAVQALVAAGLVVQRRGSGTFVTPRPERLQQPLSHLTSFSEDMARRGKQAADVWLSRGLHAPTPQEMLALALSLTDRVARLHRVRCADGLPMAVEEAALPAALLPDPAAVEGSLYAALAARGLRPVRALQRLSAANAGPTEAQLLQIAPGAAVLRIERLSYLASGRVVEFTRSVYRGDAYDFAAELQIPPDTPA